jgi:hypothetical protein
MCMDTRVAMERTCLDTPAVDEFTARKLALIWTAKKRLFDFSSQARSDRRGWHLKRSLETI